MPAQAALSEAEYLRTSFPGVDREYRDGEVVERSVPNKSHGKTVYAISGLFFSLRPLRRVFGLTETRVRIRAGRYLVPDFAVYREEPAGEVPETPPLIVAEVLSPSDSLHDVRRKLAEYREWGVPHVWLVEPDARVLQVYDGVLREVDSYHVPELGLTIRGGDLFG